MSHANTLDRQDYSASVQFLISFACGLFIANIYYAQPLTGLIGPAL